MPTNRVPIHRRSNRPVISAEVIELYRRGREILAEGGDEKWERDGGRRREFFDIDVKLGSLLRRGVYMVSVFDDLSGDPPKYTRRHNDGWSSGQELQRQLDAALEASADLKAVAPKRRRQRRPEPVD